MSYDNGGMSDSESQNMDRDNARKTIERLTRELADALLHISRLNRELAEMTRQRDELRARDKAITVLAHENERFRGLIAGWAERSDAVAVVLGTKMDCQERNCLCDEMTGITEEMREAAKGEK